MVRRPVDGEVRVHYGQLYVESDPDGAGPDLANAFAGQRSGLCGAAVPGALWLTTGLHTGTVGFTVEVHEQAPPLDEGWEDVVEVSFRPASDECSLVEWGGGVAGELDLAETDHRVRYCARGMDEGHRLDTLVSGEPPVDRYLLQFWPAPPAPDRVLRQTSAQAAYWHDCARKLPPPPTPEERAAEEDRARLARERVAEENRAAAELWEWGGRRPSAALRGVTGNVRGLLEFDAPLLHALDDAGPRARYAVARFAARRACTVAGLAELDWVAAALTALDEDRPLPPPFDDRVALWQVLAGDPRVPDRAVRRAVPPEREPFRPPHPDPDGPWAVPLPQPKPASWPEPFDAKVPHPPAPAVEGAVFADATAVAEGAVFVEGAAFGTFGYTVRGSAAGFGPVEPDWPVSQPHMALPAVVGAAEPDSLRAAIDAVYAAVVTYGEDHRTLLAQVRAVLAEHV
ncbi:hypothetical protein AB0E96_08885 [Kitasatospora sp. NPDC036755]|uniref:hypothetical protein n=1 Tax=Kitasatospora sp. NPDC036755 TaxID=3154600 RepID=UPI0033F42853